MTHDSWGQSPVGRPALLLRAARSRICRKGRAQALRLRGKAPLASRHFVFGYASKGRNYYNRHLVCDVWFAGSAIGWSAPFGFAPLCLRVRTEGCTHCSRYALLKTIDFTLTMWFVTHVSRGERPVGSPHLASRPCVPGHALRDEFIAIGTFFCKPTHD